MHALHVNYVKPSPSQCTSCALIMSTEYPASTGPCGKSLHPSLLLLVVDPLHADPASLKSLPVPPDGLPEMLRPQRPTPIIWFRRLCLRTCLAIRSRCRFHGGWMCWEVGLFLVHPLDPFALHPSCAFDDVANEHFCYCAHAYDNVLGNRLGDGGVDELRNRLAESWQGAGRRKANRGQRSLTRLTDALLRFAARQFSKR